MEKMKGLRLSFSPHIRDNSSVTKVMLDVIIALVPAAAAGVYFFGVNALITILVSIASAVAVEALIQFLCKRKVTVSDLSAVVTGLLLALNLPPNVPIYIPIVGATFAIAIVKQCFGGLGHNFMNPALAARAVLMVAWPVAMMTWYLPGAVDTICSATPMAILKSGDLASMPSILDMFLGNTAGCIGETSALALLIGGIYLVARKVISPRIPLCYLGTVAVLACIVDVNTVVYHLLGGGLMLGAIFMATDYVSSPVTKGAQIIYGIGCGVVTIVIRVFGGYAEGVSFAILFMNLVAPLLEKMLKPKVLGEVREK